MFYLKINVGNKKLRKLLKTTRERLHKMVSDSDSEHKTQKQKQKQTETLSSCYDRSISIYFTLTHTIGSESKVIYSNTSTFFLMLF